jgi:peptidoglycan/LPS O-acetylase OafA/YrhL
MQGIRRDQITFTRFIAAVAIVIFHFGRDIAIFSFEPLASILKNANIGVSYFFTLSGFIMILAYGQKEKIKPAEYYRSRIARVAPAYYAALVLFAPFIIANPSNFDYFGLALNVTLTQAWVPSKALSVNQPGWSLSVELLFYALFPLIFNKFYRGRNLRIVTVVGIAFFCISQAAHIYLLNSAVLENFPEARQDFIYYFPLMHLNEFIIGNIAGLFYISYLSHLRRPNGAWIILAISALLLLLAAPPLLPLHNGLMVIVFVPLILLIVSDAGVFSRLMSLKPLVYLGEISFGIYIFQVPVYMFCMGIFKRVGMLDTSIQFFSYMTVLLVISALSFNYIEAPLRRRINKKHGHISTLKVA